MTEKKERKGNKALIVIVVLLLATIGVLLWLLLKPQPEPEKIATGNIDVFDIRIGCLCKGEDGEECDDDDDEDGRGDGFIPGVTPGASSGTEAKKKSEKKINGKTEDETDVDREGIVYVDDKNGWYVYQKSLEIFNNAAFEYTSKIAPGVSNSYNFKVHNETDNTIRYNVEFLEESEYAINMKYRLKRASAYVVGSDTEWVSASDLITSMKYLASDGVDTYTLDWKWPYEDGKDAEDTEIGENMTSEYYLGIKVNFEEV